MKNKILFYIGKISAGLLVAFGFFNILFKRYIRASWYDNLAKRIILALTAIVFLVGLIIILIALFD
jgi:hypothetical protein